jgi:hypothetical protein
MADDEPMLPVAAQMFADDMCSSLGIIRTSEITWRVMRPAQIDGEPVPVTLPDGTTVRSMPTLLVSFDGIEP